ncbi:MAG: hypothetical protein EAZ92_06920 [Candidatus Kapaibacterium sp.]|nr:MAG: hypothetical protein EAZ92_06920 [Candidatus Kapabacteria bacterium]
MLGASHFLALGAFSVLMLVDSRTLNNVNVWLKPMKFAISIGIFSWTMAWLLVYLPESRTKNVVVWTITVTMVIEMVCIAGQAGRGVLSHFNISSPMNGAIYALMGIAIGVNTFAVAGVLRLFFQETTIDAETTYLWAIRCSLCIFIVASLQGYLMGGRLQHSVGAPDGTFGLPFLAWSRSVGDLRVMHFIGLHAIQVLPLLGFFLARVFAPSTATSLVLGAFVVYALLCVLALVQALAGQPFVRLS